MWCSNQLTHSPWFLNYGEVNDFQRPCLHWHFEVGPPTTRVSLWPLNVMLLRSAVPYERERREVNVWPLTPVIVAPAEAFVVVLHGFARCRTPSLKVEVGEQVAPGPTNVQGESAASSAHLRSRSSRISFPGRSSGRFGSVFGR
jgi:hypothetical protein